jgi:hypothetical protein
MDNSINSAAPTNSGVNTRRLHESNHLAAYQLPARQPPIPPGTHEDRPVARRPLAELTPVPMRRQFRKRSEPRIVELCKRLLKQPLLGPQV